MVLVIIFILHLLEFYNFQSSLCAKHPTNFWTHRSYAPIHFKISTDCRKSPICNENGSLYYHLHLYFWKLSHIICHFKYNNSNYLLFHILHQITCDWFCLLYHPPSYTTVYIPWCNYLNILHNKCIFGIYIFPSLCMAQQPLQVTVQQNRPFYESSQCQW